MKVIYQQFTQLDIHTGILTVDGMIKFNKLPILDVNPKKPNCIRKALVEDT